MRSKTCLLIGVLLGCLTVSASELDAKYLRQLAKDLDEVADSSHLKEMTPTLASLFEVDEQWFGNRLKARRYRVSDFAFAGLEASCTETTLQEVFDAADEKADWPARLQEAGVKEQDITDVFLFLQAELSLMKFDRKYYKKSQQAGAPVQKIIWKRDTESRKTASR